MPTVGLHQRYRRTDRRTTYDSNTALALRASHGKKLQTDFDEMFGGGMILRPSDWISLVILIMICIQEFVTADCIKLVLIARWQHLSRWRFQLSYS